MYFKDTDISVDEAITSHQRVKRKTLDMAIVNGTVKLSYTKYTTAELQYFLVKFKFLKFRNYKL